MLSMHDMQARSVSVSRSVSEEKISFLSLCLPGITWIYLLFNLGLAILFLHNDFQEESVVFVIGISVAIQSILLLRIFSRHFNNNAYNALFFYLVSFFLVYFQMPLTHIFDGEISPVYLKHLAYETIYPAAVYAFISHTVFCMAYLGCASRRPFSQVRQRLMHDFSLLSATRLKTVITILSCIDLVIFAFFLIAAGPELYLHFRYYDGMYQHAFAAMVFYSLHSQLQTVIISLLAVHVCTIRVENVKEVLCHYSLLGVYFLFTSIFFLLNGDRGAYLEVFCSLAAIFFLFVKAISYKKIFLLFLIVIPIFFYIGRNRNGNSSDFSLWEFSMENIPTMDLAGQFPLWTRVLDIFPQNLPYRNGQHTFHDIKKLVPGLSTLLLMGEETKDATEVSSGALMTEILLNNQYGAGTVSLADPYIDFGLKGIIVFSLIVGVIFGLCMKICVRSIWGSVFFVHSSVFLCYVAIYLCRSSLISHLRVLMFSGIIVCFLIKLFCMKKRRVRVTDLSRNEFFR